MSRLNTIYTTWQEIAVRLRRRGALASLIAMLSIGLFEPLACIAHCEFLEIVHVHSQQAAHAHHHAHSSRASGSDTDGAAARDVYDTAQPAFEQTASTCTHSIPQPFHEMTLLFVLLLVPLTFVARQRASKPHPPDQHSAPPLRRPPILCV